MANINPSPLAFFSRPAILLIILFMAAQMAYPVPAATVSKIGSASQLATGEKLPFELHEAAFHVKKKGQTPPSGPSHGSNTRENNNPMRSMFPKGT